MISPGPSVLHEGVLTAGGPKPGENPPWDTSNCCSYTSAALEVMGTCSTVE